MWIESHQSLKDHPKLSRLARYLRINRAQAIGHLHCMWWFALDYAADHTGELIPKYDREDIETAALWDGEPGAFVAAAIRAGFLDQDGETVVIHDWSTYIGKLLEKRAKDARRKQKQHSAVDLTY